jgi:hypothetical protein
MRRIEQAHGLQVGKNVPDRRRRERVREALGQRSRADRFAGGKKRVHQMPEYLSRPLAKLAYQQAGL